MLLTLNKQQHCHFYFYFLRNIKTKNTILKIIQRVKAKKKKWFAKFYACGLLEISRQCSLRQVKKKQLKAKG